MKATHKGTCQCCGSLQKLPSGFLSNHGYTVDWGMFNGTCQGAGHKPFEQSTDLIEMFIDQAKTQLNSINKEIDEVSDSTDSEQVWYKRYVPTTYGKKSNTVWEKRGLLLDRVISDTCASWKWDSLPNDTKDVNRGKPNVGGYGVSTISEAVKFENAKYTAVLSRKIVKIEEYITWQEERIANWTEQPLTKLK